VAVGGPLSAPPTPVYSVAVGGPLSAPPTPVYSGAVGGPLSAPPTPVYSVAVGGPLSAPFTLKWFSVGNWTGTYRIVTQNKKKNIEFNCEHELQNCWQKIYQKRKKKNIEIFPTYSKVTQNKKKKNWSIEFICEHELQNCWQNICQKRKKKIYNSLRPGNFWSISLQAGAS
jgi:hypothetical protein